MFIGWIENFPPVWPNGPDDTEAVELCTATLTKTLKDRFHGGGWKNRVGERRGMTPKGGSKRPTPKGLSKYITGCFRKWGVFPPKSWIFIGFSMIFTIHFGVPLFLETPWWQLKVCLNLLPRNLGKMNPFWGLHIFQRGWWKTTN